MVLNMEIEDGYYWSSDPVYVGTMPVRSELTVMPQNPEVKGWTIEKIVSINGNKYLRLLKKYLKRRGKTSEDELTEKEIEKLLSKCEFK